jgi:uncharacterized protein YajQ (UPF0234 family)
MAPKTRQASTNALKSRIDKIQRRYDPENDVHNVTWAEADLVEIVSGLLDRIEQLEQLVDIVHGKVVR